METNERNRVDELREPFDRAFAEAPTSTVSDDEQLVTIAFDANKVFALALPELSGVYRGATIVPLLGAPPGLLGIVGIRGNPVAVYSLASLLRIETEDTAETWIAVTAADRSVGLTFGDFRGYLVVPRKSIVAAPEGAPELVRSMVRVDGGTISILDVSRLLAARRERPR